MLKQAAVLSMVALREIPSRWGASSVVVVSMLATTSILMALLALGEGLAGALDVGGGDDRVLIIRNSAGGNEVSSFVPRGDAALIFDSPGIARDAEGRPAAAAEALMLSLLRKRDSNKPVYVNVRGVAPDIGTVRPDFRIVSGRMFTSGVREVVVGHSAQAVIAGTSIGDRIELGLAQFVVVGTFETGSARDSEIWGDTEALMTAFQRKAFTSVTAKVDAGGLASLRTHISSNPGLAYTVVTEREYFSSLAGRAGQIKKIAYLIGGIMALGAFFSAINSSFGAVRARAKEIATLRSLGFSDGAILISVLAELVSLCLIGALLAIVVVSWGFEGQAVSTVAGQTAGQVAYVLQLSPEVAAQAVLWAVMVGIVGGVPSAVRALRRPIADGLLAS